MKLTLENIASGSCQKKIKNQSIEAFLKRMLHCSLVGKDIHVMENFDFCTRLNALYLYDNMITEICGLQNCTMLTQLYLQDNQITGIEGLQNLSLLTILSLSGNKIQYVCGLESLFNLEILHLDQQKIDSPMEFDQKSMECLGQSLKKLTLSDANIHSIEPLSLLFNLQELDISNNNLKDIRELEHVLTFCNKLKILYASHNPFCTNIRLRQRIILSSESLDSFNDKDITNIERGFLRNMMIAKSKRSNKSSEETCRVSDQNEEQEEDAPIPHLPPYASQYRDLMIQQQQQNLNTQTKSLYSKSSLYPLKVIARAAESLK